MSPAYRRGVVENFRNAEVVFDKFHLIAHAGEVVDAMRRLKSALDVERISALKETRWLWLKNPENLTPNQKRTLTRIDRDSLWTAKACQMRPALQAVYQPPRRVAKKRFATWTRWDILSDR